MSNKVQFPGSMKAQQMSGQMITVGIVIFVIALLGFQSFVIIPPGFRGVSVTLGTVDPHFRGEGMSFKLPFIEDVIKVPVKQITVEGDSSCFSSDLQSVKVAFKTLYRLPEAKVVDLYQKFQGDPYFTLVEPRIQETMKEETSKYRAEDLVKNREAVKVKVLNSVQSKLEGLVEIIDIPISDIGLNPELEAAIERKQIKEQEALAKRYELDKAVKEAEITIVNAEAEAKAVQIKGQALKASPHVIDLEIAKRWDGKAPGTVVLGKDGGSVILPMR